MPLTATAEIPCGIEVANGRAAQIHEIRRGLRSGTITLQQVMTSPPPVMADLLLIDVLRLCRARRTAPYRALTKIGAAAIRDDVNLMQRLGDASVRSRAWVAEYGMAGVHIPQLRARGLV